MAIPAWTANVSTSRWSAAENSAAPALSVRYRLPTERPFTVIGTPRKLCIGGWFGGNPWRRGSTAMSGIRNERFSLMIRPRNPWPRGSGADRGSRLQAHPRRDEALDHAVRVDDPKGGIPGPDERADLIDDHLQDIVDRLEAGDRPRRHVEGVDDVGRSLWVLAIVHARHGSSVRVIPHPAGPPGPEMRAGWPMASGSATRSLWG